VWFVSRRLDPGSLLSDSARITTSGSLCRIS
jgi:hypothetical protein